MNFVMPVVMCGECKFIITRDGWFGVPMLIINKSALRNPEDPYLTGIYGNLSCMPYTRKAGMNARNLVYE